MDPPDDYWKCAKCGVSLPSITDVKSKWLKVEGGDFHYSLCKKCIKKKKFPNIKKKASG